MADHILGKDEMLNKFPLGIVNAFDSFISKGTVLKEKKSNELALWLNNWKSGQIVELFEDQNIDQWIHRLFLQFFVDDFGEILLKYLLLSA